MAKRKKLPRVGMGEVVRFCDYDKRSRIPDAVVPRNPVDADVIVLPVIRIEPPCDIEPEAYSLP